LQPGVIQSKQTTTTDKRRLENEKAALQNRLDDIEGRAKQENLETAKKVGDYKSAFEQTQTEVAKLREANEKLQRDNERSLITGKLTELASQNNIRPNAISKFIDFEARNFKWNSALNDVEVVDLNGEARYDSVGNKMSKESFMQQYVKENDFLIAAQPGGPDIQSNVNAANGLGIQPPVKQIVTKEDERHYNKRLMDEMNAAGGNPNAFNPF